MSLRRVFVPPGTLGPPAVTLEGDAHHHVARVLRAAAGDVLRLFDGRGREAEARVLAVGRHRTTLAVDAPVDAAPLPGARVTLWQGLARAERMDLITEKTTELGVGALVPILAARSQGHGDPAARVARWRRIAQEAARQCGRADVPAVGEATTWPAALAGVSPAARKIVLWESATRAPALATLVEPDVAEVVLAVGPEGGLSDGEVEALLTGGFEMATLGPRTLRTETAAIVAVALVQAATGGLGALDRTRGPAPT